MIAQFAYEVAKQIRKDMNNYADDIAGGNCKNFEEYQKLCGVIHGLAIAEQYIKDYAKNVEEDNE